MEEGLIIQLGAAKNKNAINVDQNITIGLENSANEILSYNESSIIDVAQLFDQERQESEVYRIYGRTDFISIINGLKRNYSTINDFFRPQRLGDELAGLTKNLPYSFDMYLCYPSSGKTYISGGTGTTDLATYIRDYVIASRLVNGEVFKSGFGRNVYFNYTYTFDFNIDFNVESYLDAFHKPITELYLFFVYKTQSGETYFRRDWVNTGTTIPITYNSTTGYSVGDVLVGDKVTYMPIEFEETLVDRQTHYITFPYSTTAGTQTLQFKYNPFIPIKLRDFGDELITANISGGTENDFTIPSYAIPIDNKGNYLWKDILPNGYIDPITGAGVDYPFVNKRHYVFNRVTLPLVPDTSHANTNTVFSVIKFGPNSQINTKPMSDLNALGNRCA